MRVPLSWLRDYVELDILPQELAEKLTMAGLEVDSIQTIGGGWDRIVVGQVSKLEKHPNADRLQLATIDLGTERLTVVSGAPNLKPGDKVPFARVGARLLNPHTGELAELKPAKIRGVVSQGMACSEKELGISDDHTGIMILPPEAPVGVPLQKYLGDFIFDIKVTPNRPDCLSILGIAWEVAALTGKSVRLPQVRYVEAESPVAEFASVEIADPDLCPRYCASIVTEVNIKPSPRWMQDRLIRCGMRPINNVVDITNYVMLEYGQPLHAFDYHGIGGRKIIVRRARPGEVLTTLDGSPRPLVPEMLAIADAREPVALAGVMGGAASEVTEQTRIILLESANFNGASLRRTGGQLRMRTEASLRFEKGLSADLPLPALRRATQLLVELAEGKAAKGVIDVYPGKMEKTPIRLTGAKVKRVLGLEVSQEQTSQTLSSLGFQCQALSPTEIAVTPPYWRSDIHLTEDLAEEVARIIGYDRIPTTTVSGRVPEYHTDPVLLLKERIRDILVGCGMQEIITHSLTSRQMLERIRADTRAVRLANPMSLEQEYLRTSLRATLLQTLAANRRYESGAIRLFELGKIYLPWEKDLPEEREMVAGVLSGRRAEGIWAAGEKGYFDFFDAKGIVETLLEWLGLDASFEPAEDSAFIAGKVARMASEGNTLGVLGEIQPGIAFEFDLKGEPVCLFELDVRKLLSLITPARKYQVLPRFPGIVRDLALVVSMDVLYKKVQDIIRGFPLVSQVILFDMYVGRQLSPGKKSLACRIVYQLSDRTLTDEEVDKAQEDILRRLDQEVGAVLRG